MLDLSLVPALPTGAVESPVWLKLVASPTNIGFAGFAQCLWVAISGALRARNTSGRSHIGGSGNQFEAIPMVQPYRWSMAASEKQTA
jgi:hypothetical protein